MNDLPEIKDKNINYFICPTMWQEVIFRNYGMVTNSTLSKILGTSEDIIAFNAALLGLDKLVYNPKWLSLGYITIIRANWHILPYEQIAEVLGITLEKLSVILREEDFLNVKLGNFKPKTDAVKYLPLSCGEYEQTLAIGKIVQNNYLSLQQSYFDFAKSLSSETFNNNFEIIDNTKSELTQRYISFTKKYYDLSHLAKQTIKLELCNMPISQESYRLQISDCNISISATTAVGIFRGLQEIAENTSLKSGEYLRIAKIEQRIIHSYLGGCGDILNLEKNDYFSDELLTRLAKAKVNGIWLTAIFYQLREFAFDKKISEGHEKRIAILQALQQKLDCYGLKLYLYINEPRCLPMSFFESQPELLGEQYNGDGAMCTSNHIVKEYITDSAEYVCRKIPSLGGFISITMSENLTNCYSRNITNFTSCHKCSERSREDVTAEVNNLIYKGIKQAASTAKLIAWNWGYTTGYGWSEQQTYAAFERLDKGIDFMAISEDLMQIEKMGVKTYVQDYSISNIGPSERTKNMINKASEQGRKSVVKVQLSNSWEMCITPYLPVFETNYKHLCNLAAINVGGLMLSWTHGGYPSPNLDVAKLFYYDTPRSLKSFYKKQYGTAANTAESIVKIYSQAFSQYPFSLELIYTGAQHTGVTNPFYAVKTNMAATMVGFAYDDLSLWRGNYSENAFIKMLENMLKKIDSAKELMAKLSDCNESESELKIYCNIFYCTIKSLYNQAQFIMARDKADKQGMIKFIDSETLNVKFFYENYVKSCLIGYEASNHYLFNQNNILQKIVNLQLLHDEIAKGELAKL